MPPNDAALAAAPPGATLPPGPPVPPASLLQAVRHAGRAPAGAVALRVRVTAGPEAAPRLVRQVLEDAARGGGVHLLGPADFLLVEATPGAAREARGAIAALLPGAALPEFTLWTLPGDAPALLALAAEATVAAPAVPAAPVPLRGLDALADGLALGAVLRRNAVLALGAPGQMTAGPVRLGLRQDALRAALGPPGADHDLLRHARDRLARRLLATLADDAGRRGLLGPAPPRRLIVEVAPDALPLRGPAPDALAEVAPITVAPALFAALPLSAAADPDLLARRRGALEAHGWGLALRNVTAALLTAVAIETLDADLLLLRWSPELAGRGPAAAIRRLDPARLLLLGADEEEALRWGIGQGIRLFGGAHPELILGAARMAACPARAQCTRRQCIQRAAASAAAGREGCAEPGLLSAILPGAEMAA